MSKHIKAIIFDVDGVIWRSKKPIGNVAESFKILQERGIKYAFATNNSTKTRHTYQEAIAEIGIPVEVEQIFTSGSVTAAYLIDNFSPGAEIHVIGMAGLRTTILDAGFGIGDKDPEAVVVGLDSEINYKKISLASKFVRAGKEFIGTNPDVSLPSTEGLLPGNGSILAAIEATTKVSPIIIGKPMPAIFLSAMKYLGQDSEETLVIGDRLDTDIAGGQAAGCKVACVFSGVSGKIEAEEWQPKIDYFAQDVNKLIEEFYGD